MTRYYDEQLAGDRLRQCYELALPRVALRVTRPGGRVILSTYSDAFWPHCLEWFEAQASAGLVGPIDREATRPGLVVCEDGFRSGTLSAQQLTDLCNSAGVSGEITEVDGSSLFCEIHKR